MKYILSTLFILTLMTYGFTQNIDFTLATPQPMIQETYGGSLLSGDLDNDGDMDLVQSGISAKISVFLNDGNGNFTLEEQNFIDYWSTEGAILADFDNDDDLDIIITALNSTDFYRNNGQAQFILDDSTPFSPSFFGNLIAGDVDGDGDNDVIQFGKTGSGSADPFFALMFLNDGSGAFTQSENITFEPFEFINLDFIDLEGDGDLDILSFGENEMNESQLRIFENDGSGSYSIFSESNITPQQADEINVGDIDNDGDDDVLISGKIGNTPKTSLYINDGNGQFSELVNTPFPDIFASSNAFADLDNDNDLDVLLMGSQVGGLPNIISIVFENLGDNSFVAADSLVGEYIVTNTIADFNGDDKKDMIIQGFVDDTNIYWNVSDISTGIAEDLPLNFSVSPNPSNGQLQIEWGERVVNRVEIIHSTGKLILGETINGQGLHNMNLDLPSGVYLLKIYEGNIISTHKIFLTR